MTNNHGTCAYMLIILYAMSSDNSKATKRLLNNILQ